MNQSTNEISYKPVRLYLHSILTMSLKECQTKSFGMNLLLHAIFKFCTTKRLCKQFSMHLFKVIFRVWRNEWHTPKKQAQETADCMSVTILEKLLTNPKIYHTVIPGIQMKQTDVRLQPVALMQLRSSNSYNLHLNWGLECDTVVSKEKGQYIT